MRKLSPHLSSVDRLFANRRLGMRARRNRRCSLESLENRIVLSYAFSYNALTHVAVAADSGSNKDSLVIKPVSGILEHSVNSGTGAQIGAA